MSAAYATELPIEVESSVRQRILNAAKTEFAAHGLKGASVRAIGNRAGTTPAMINYYFRGKELLYHEVVEVALGGLLGRLSKAMTVEGEDDLAVRLAGAYFDFLSEERELQRLFVREVLEGSKTLPSMVRRHLLPIRAMVIDRFGPEDSAFQSAISLFGAVAGYFLYAPVLAELSGADPLCPENLARRRRHILEAAGALSEGRNRSAGRAETTSEDEQDTGETE